MNALVCSLTPHQLAAQELDLGEPGNLVGCKVANLVPEDNRAKLFKLPSAPPSTYAQAHVPASEIQTLSEPRNPLAA